MTLTRRQFLATAGGTAGATLLAPIFGRVGPAFGQTGVDPATAQRNRLVVVFLEGGNDGLNYVVPRGDVTSAPRYSVYRKVRPSVAYKPTDSLLLDHGNDAVHALGFNKKLVTLHKFYKQGRVAIVQGVDYPEHSYSHFTSTDIWHSGEPQRAPRSGWLGRHLDRSPAGDGELRGVGIGPKVPLILSSQNRGAAAISSIAAMKFVDGDTDIAKSRHATLAGFGVARPSDPLRQAAARIASQTVAVVDDLAKTTAPPAAGSTIGDSLLTARVLLEQNLGVECVFLTHPGFDTHTGQISQQERLLGELDTALETFYLGTANGNAVGNIGPLAPAVASRTLVMIVSEFGRRIGEAGGASAAGTDHGAAAPIVLLGPAGTGANGAALNPGLHGDHPNMGTPALPADNLEMTTDLRSLYQSVLTSWLSDPEPLYDSFEPVSGLFSGVARVPKMALPGTRGKGGSRAAALGAGVAAETATSAPSAGAIDNKGTGGATALGPSRHTSGHKGLHPVSAGAALLFDAFVAALLIRSGHLRELATTLRSRGGDAPAPSSE